MATTLTALLQEKDIYTSELQERSSTWYVNKAKGLSYIDRSKVLNSGSVSGNIVPGMMFIFIYDPKTKDRLPFYDKFPLVFPYDYDSDGFIGLNMHYLPRAQRTNLMNALLKYSTKQGDDVDEKTKILFNYQILKSSISFSGYRACLKRYRFDHVRSELIIIPATEWQIALYLPLENFAKASINTVYRKSRELM